MEFRDLLAFLQFLLALRKPEVRDDVKKIIQVITKFLKHPRFKK